MADSVALGKFRAALALSQGLLAIEASMPDPAPAGDARRALGLRGGAAVLMVAAFEAYLRAGIAEIICPLLGQPTIPAVRFPAKMKVAAAFESLEMAMYAPRYGLPNGKAARLPEIQLAASRVAAGQFIPDALAQTKSNPNPQTVVRILQNLGLQDPLTIMRPTFDSRWAKPETVNFVGDKLEEIVQRRHRVAHSADASGIARSDVTDAARFLLVLAETIDADVQKHIAAI